jgi:hypothetical protein
LSEHLPANMPPELSLEHVSHLKFLQLALHPTSAHLSRQLYLFDTVCCLSSNALLAE